MNDQEFEALRSKCETIVLKWRHILGLDGHRINFRYKREYEKSEYTLAHCFPLWEYKSHTVEFFLPSINECHDDDEIEEDILHELVHILLAPATGNDPPENKAQLEKNEFAVQSVTFALIWAYREKPKVKGKK